MKCAICNKQTKHGQQHYVNELDAKLWVCYECLKPDQVKHATLSLRLPIELAEKLPKKGKSAFIRRMLYDFFAKGNKI